ncbi:N-acetylmuramic acid 6-phosphate etherase [Nocardioides albus]|uniref:N-acetylmuramic acid 6-phosphate etherase n=1 Tax=Nocardioides albus TaxID=1841 RepID=A0A7W5A5F6_9ACTN|nr:N-acetylmuramic acid 6-phosphate etherase [Nocardioides albus]MBB3089775.1 N-acetylmuramic acid 6-phosphate etherase [Nocardioides albus]GGU35548.1 N-acetylmuramic acid 6-phosphate etherase [Nocardioides albus]
MKAGPVNAEDGAMLDALTTEASSSTGGPEIDQLSVTDLIAAMNERDATVAASVRSALPTIAAAVTAATERMREGGRLIYVGAGTSGRLGVLDASEVPPTFGVDEVVVGVIAGGPAALVSAAEGAEDDEQSGADDLAALDVGPLDTVVGIASSGRTPYVLGALEHAAEIGALTVGLACNLGTPLGRAADHGIEVPVGPEVVAGSTRLGAGTATKMVLNMLSTATMVQLGRTYGSLMVDMRANNAKLRHRAVRMVTEATGAEDATAVRALDEAGWHTKLAIATILTGLSPTEASQALERAGGRLRTVIEERG